MAKKGFQDYTNRIISKNDFCMFFGFTHGEAITKYYKNNYGQLLLDAGFNSGSEAYFSGGINAWLNLRAGKYTFPPIQNEIKESISTGKIDDQSIELISSDDPTKFVWSCIKLFNEKQDLKQLFTSKYKSLGGSIGNYIRINECYVAQIGKSDIKEIESIQIYDGSFLNAGFDARDIERFKDAVNDVFKGKYN